MFTREWLVKNYRQIIFYLMLALLIFAISLTPTDYDYDLWARLIVGKCFFQTGHVLKQDFLSYTPTHIWYDHEWGSGVVFYFIQHYFSPLAFIIFQDILIFIIFFLIIQTIKLRGVKTTHPYNFLFYFFSIFAFLQVFLQFIRCQLFSFFFFAVFLYILELARKGKNKPLCLLPIFMLIWNNLHGGCVAGLGLIAIYFVGELINRKPAKKYLLIFLLSFLVLVINPWGIDYVTFLIRATTMPRPSIAEWMPLFSQDYKYTFLEFKYFFAVMIFSEIGYIIYALKKKEFILDVTKYLALVLTMYLALKHVKMIPFAVISMSVFLYDDFYTLFNFITLNAIKKVELLKDSLVYIVVLFYLFNIIKSFDFKPFMTFVKFPIQAIEFIKINNLKGNLLTNFEFGSYASYKLYPHNKIYMDGRYEEVYGDDIKNLMDVFTSGNDKNNVLLNNFPTDMILLSRRYAICSLLEKDPKWKQAFADPNVALFVRAKDYRNDYKMPSSNIDYYKKTMFDTDIDFRGNMPWSQNLEK